MARELSRRRRHTPRSVKMVLLLWIAVAVGSSVLMYLNDEAQRITWDKALAATPGMGRAAFVARAAVYESGLGSGAIAFFVVAFVTMMVGAGGRFVATLIIAGMVLLFRMQLPEVPPELAIPMGCGVILGIIAYVGSRDPAVGKAA